MRHGSVTKSFAAVASPRPATSPPPRTVVPPLTSNAPSQRYRQHHEVEAPRIGEKAFRPHWLVKTHVLALLEAGRIDRDQFAAALAWCSSWVAQIGRTSGQKWVLRVGHSPAPGVPPQQLFAAGQLPASALGPERTALLEWSLVSDWTWGRDAGKLGLSDRTAKDRIVEAIAALTLWRQGRPVPPPPAHPVPHQAEQLRRLPARPAGAPAPLGSGART